MKELWFLIGFYSMSHEINRGGEHFRLYDVNADTPLELVELVYNVTPPSDGTYVSLPKRLSSFEG